ncbi:hypothetical protein ACQ4PT_062208 [Festuca glaucescens]
MEAARQRQPPSSHVADDPNVLLHEGRNIEADTDVTDAISFTQIVAGNGFDKLSSSQQAAFMDGVFGDPVAQSPYNSPHESPYDSPHEVLTNGVCKTCHELDGMCCPDEDLPSDEGDADTLAADEETTSFQALLEIQLFVWTLDLVSVHKLMQMQQGRWPALGHLILFAHRRILSRIHPFKIVAGNGFDKLSSSQQAAFMDGVFGDPVAQSPYNSPHESPYDSPHEVLTNGVCKTCHELDGMCCPDEDLPSDEGDADTLAADEETTSFQALLEIQLFVWTLDLVSIHKLMQMQQGRWPALGHLILFAHRRILSRIHPFKSSPLPPPLYDKTPNLHRDSLTPSVDGTEHVTQSWEVSQQLRDAGLRETASWNKLPYLPSPVYDKTPKHHRHGTENLADQQESLQLMCDREESLLNCEELHPGQKYDSSMAVKYLSEHLNGVDPKQIKQILWTYHHSNHFSVYCVNWVNTRIDVLDSIDWRKNGGSFEDRNDPWGYRSIQRLSDAFQTVMGK